ncbi:hypothetical protein JNUCC42_00220 [Brevibacterium sp. JNUCC-42]|nr:hypothetical protein JNUCC42_00220 [Brevibacterium sp. JNUCC-42]
MFWDRNNWHPLCGRVITERLLERIEALGDNLLIYQKHGVLRYRAGLLNNQATMMNLRIQRAAW